MLPSTITVKYKEATLTIRLNSIVVILRSTVLVIQNKGAPKQILTMDNTNTNRTMKKRAITNENKSYGCEFCDSKFTQKSNMKQHIETVHKGTKSYICEFCNSTFSRNSNRKTHIKTIHEKKKPFKCDVCNRSFAIKSTLQKHIRSIHGDDKIISY